jgi:polynucleotide 5'-hydroxyl-kinase GRC3/NOL9
MFSLKWKKLLKRKPLRILILGDVDTGKTTFSLYLTQKLLDKKRKVCLFCTDIGQSLVGPPSCIAYKILKKSFRKIPAHLKEERMEFIGSFSPVSILLPFLVNIKILLEEVENKVDTIVINTTGYIKTKEAVFLKIEKIRLIKPDIIFAFQRKKELEPILEKFYSHPHLKIYHLKPPSSIRKRTLKERAEYRQNILKNFFKNSYLYKIETKTSYLREKMLVGLLNKELKTVSLGIVIKIDKDKITLLTPLKNLREIKFTKPSSISWGG